MGKQVDGTHYEDMPRGYQPWDIIKALNLDYWEGSVLKYLLRAGNKPGVLKSTDLRKAVHQLTEYAEMTERMEARMHANQATPGPLGPQPVQVDPTDPSKGYRWEGEHGPELSDTTPLVWDHKTDSYGTPKPGEKHKDAG